LSVNTTNYTDTEDVVPTNGVGGRGSSRRLHLSLFYKVVIQCIAPIVPY
jgi:hypothetical protein